MMNPQGSGSSACASQSVSEDVRATFGEFIARSGWHGLFMVELLRDESGKVWFVELNGRPWAAWRCAGARGSSIRHWHVELALDKDSRVGSDASLVPRLFAGTPGANFMHVLFVLRGARSNA